MTEKSGGAEFAEEFLTERTAEQIERVRSTEGDRAARSLERLNEEIKQARSAGDEKVATRLQSIFNELAAPGF